MFSTVANRAPKKQELPMKGAIRRRITKNQGEPGGGPSGGKKYLAPGNTGRAGSMITPNPKKGAYSTFVNDNFKTKKFSFGK